MTEENTGSKMSRRRFIRNSSYAAGGVIGGGVLGTVIGTNLTDDTNNQSKQAGNDTNFNHALMFFSRQADFNILSAATERIFPEDENGPGAIELGVPYFIDHQLDGAYGRNDKEYMQGPFSPGTDYQGYQSPLKRNELFLMGIRKLDEESTRNYDASFTDLEEEQQDEILQKFENNEVKLKGATSRTFFQSLRSATMEGAYSDPLYGGNANMAAWKMKEFPGSQMSYIDELNSDAFIEMEPKALRSHTSS